MRDLSLTKRECKVAADRARTYPPGFGHTYFAIEVTNADLEAEGCPDKFIDCLIRLPLSDNKIASWWAHQHPEHVQTLG